MPVVIKAKVAHGFRRCGVFHMPQPVEHPDGKFTDEQIRTLKAEPLLEVVEAPARKRGRPPKNVEAD